MVHRGFGERKQRCIVGQGEEAPVSRTSWAGLIDVVRVEPEGAASWEGGGVQGRVQTSSLNDQLTVLQIKTGQLTCC